MFFADIWPNLTTPRRAEIAHSAFLIALCALFLPIVEKGYGLVVATCGKICCCCRRDGEEFSAREACFALMAFVLALPSVILTFIGVASNLDGMAAATASAVNAADEGLADVLDSGDAIVDAMGSAADDIVRGDLGSAVAEAAADVASDLLYYDRVGRERRSRDHCAAAAAESAATEVAMSESDDGGESGHCGSGEDLQIERYCSELGAQVSVVVDTTPASEAERPGFSWLEDMVAENEDVARGDDAVRMPH